MLLYMIFTTGIGLYALAYTVLQFRKRRYSQAIGIALLALLSVAATVVVGSA